MDDLFVDVTLFNSVASFFLLKCFHYFVECCVWLSCVMVGYCVGDFA